MDGSGNLGIASGTVLFVLLMIGGSLLLSFTRNHREALTLQLKIFWIAFALRYAMSLAIYAMGLINVLKDEDGSGWVVGVVFNENWRREGCSAFDVPRLLLGAYSATNKGYYFLLGGLFFFTEPARLSAAAFNDFLGSLLVVYAYRIARTLFTQQVAYRVGLWLCILPSMVIWSAQTIKEPVVMFLEVLAIYGCVNISRMGFSLRHAILTSACILLLMPFRFYAAFVTAAAMGAALVLPRIQGGRISFGPTAALLIIGGIVASSGVLALGERERDLMNLKFASKYRSNMQTGDGSGSSVKMDFDMATSSGLGLSVLVGAAHLLLAPFPWQLAGGSLRMILVAPEMLFWWWLFFVGVVPGFRLLVRTRFADILPLLMVLLGFGILYSVTFGNVGLVYRQRAQLMPWLLIFAAVGLEGRSLRRVKARPVPGHWNHPTYPDADPPMNSSLENWDLGPTEAGRGPGLRRL